MATARLHLLALATLVLAGTPLARGVAFLKVRGAPGKVNGTAAATAVGDATATANAEGNVTAEGLAIAGDSAEDAAQEGEAGKDAVIGEQVGVEDAGASAEDFDADAEEEGEDPADVADSDAAEAALYGGADVADADDASPGDTDEAMLLQADHGSGDDTDETHLPTNDFLKAVQMASNLKGKLETELASRPDAPLAQPSNKTSVVNLSVNASKATAAASVQDSVNVTNPREGSERETDAEEEGLDPADAADADAAEAALYGDDGFGDDTEED